MPVQMRLMPQTRIALIREDAEAAAIFEEPKEPVAAATTGSPHADVYGRSSRGGGGGSTTGRISRASSYSLMTSQDDLSPFKRHVSVNQCDKTVRAGNGGQG